MIQATKIVFLDHMCYETVLHNYVYLSRSLRTFCRIALSETFDIIYCILFIIISGIYLNSLTEPDLQVFTKCEYISFHIINVELLTWFL